MCIKLWKKDTHSLVRARIKGEYEYRKKLYPERFNKIHKVADLYELITGKKLGE